MKSYYQMRFSMDLLFIDLKIRRSDQSDKIEDDP